MNNEALEFAQWIGNCQYTKHQYNDIWFDNDDYIGSTLDLWNMFLEYKNTTII